MACIHLMKKLVGVFQASRVCYISKPNYEWRFLLEAKSCGWMYHADVTCDALNAFKPLDTNI